MARLCCSPRVPTHVHPFDPSFFCSSLVLNHFLALLSFAVYQKHLYVAVQHYLDCSSTCLFPPYSSWNLSLSCKDPALRFQDHALIKAGQAKGTWEPFAGEDTELHKGEEACWVTMSETQGESKSTTPHWCLWDSPPNSMTGSGKRSPHFSSFKRKLPCAHVSSLGRDSYLVHRVKWSGLYCVGCL